MPKLRDLTGDTFRELTVIGPHRRNHQAKCTDWKCRCSCGNEVWVRSEYITRACGHRGNCGCKPVPRRPMSERTEMILSWREQGEKLEIIADAFKIHYASVSKLCKRHGVVPLIETEHRLPWNAKRGNIDAGA